MAEGTDMKSAAAGKAREEEKVPVCRSRKLQRSSLARCGGAYPQT